MKAMLNKVKNTKGFVSLEVIAIAVILIALAAFVMLKFRTTAETSSDTVDSQITQSITDINGAAKTTSNTNKTPVTP